jgi:signal transduction histidine kinase
MTFIAIAAVIAALGGWCAALAWAGRSRRDVERRLRDVNAHLHELVDHSSSAIYLKDRERRYLLANRRHLELWPQMENFRPGMKPAEFFSAEIARSFAESDDAVWRSGREHTFEEAIPHADGLRIYVSSKFPVRDPAGRIIAVGGISTDVTDLRRARENLARTEQILRRLIEVQEHEKQRLCHEFHDGLIQYVVGSKMLLESLDCSGLPTDCVATINDVVKQLARGLEDGRCVIRGIRPAALDDLGLAAAIDDLCQQERRGVPVIDACIAPAADAIPDSLQTTVYRVVQESLGNACRHSGADRVQVAVRVDGDAVEVIVADNGRGFDRRLDGNKGFGLLGMGERVRLSGGEFTVDTSPGAGTRVRARLPVNRESPADAIAVQQGDQTR